MKILEFTNVTPLGKCSYLGKHGAQSTKHGTQSMEHRGQNMEHEHGAWRKE